MTPEQHLHFFYEFVKGSGLFNFEYSDEPVEQTIIAVKESAVADIPGGFAVINPDWDKVYESFLKLDFNPEAVSHIKELLEEGEAVSLVTDTVKYLISKNIDSEKVYVAVGDSWDTDWANEVLGV
jgi:hypothetical protein